MTAFFESLEIERPVIVASSAGGYYALPYLMQPSPITCESRVSGFVTVGMVGAEMFTPSQYHRCNVSCRYIPWKLQIITCRYNCKIYRTVTFRFRTSILLNFKFIL